MTYLSLNSVISKMGKVIASILITLKSLVIRIFINSEHLGSSVGWVFAFSSSHDAILGSSLTLGSLLSGGPASPTPSAATSAYAFSVK